jgi:aromatic ring-opening dioxygenase catalytic subunit (LigB family)
VALLLQYELAKELAPLRNRGVLIIGSAVKMAIPSAEHYLPLLYALALKEENENISFFNDKVVMGSITMTSVKIS